MGRNMAIRDILINGDETLRKQSRKIMIFDRRLYQLLDDMADTLESAEGLGLAAPQVGELKRVVVIDFGGDIIELVNPEIVDSDGEQQQVEGCLSIPDVYGITRRPMNVKVRARNRFGRVRTYRGSGLLARAFCHEIDHLNGVLFTDNVIRIIDQDEIENKK
jgi:peptide deformylase